MELKTLKDLETWLCNEGLDRPVSASKLRHEAIRWIKKFRAMEYGENFCLNCMKVYGGGNSGSQYCCRGEDDNLHFLEQQTGSRVGAVEILVKFFNISEEDLK